MTSVQLEMNRISGVHVQVNNDRLDIPCSALVNAAGPFLANVHRMVDPSTDLKVTNVVHGKVRNRWLVSTLDMIIYVGSYEGSPERFAGSMSDVDTR